MRRLIEFFVNNHVLTISLFGAVMLFGLISTFSRGVDLMPEMDIPVVAVITAYPGAGPEEVARSVTEPIESVLATVEGLSSLTSTSSENLSTIIAQFGASTSLQDASNDVNQRVSALAGRLPTDATAPSVQRFDPSDMPILSVAVTGAGIDLAQVQAWAEDTLVPALLNADGVAAIDVAGPAEREIQVLLRPDRLESLGLSAMQVMGAISASALDVPAGSMNLGDTRILLSSRGTPQSVSQIETIRVDPVGGTTVGDVATVRDARTDVISHTRLNGEPVVILDIRKSPGTNTVATATALRDTLDAQSLPDGITVRIVNDSSEFIANSVTDTFHEMLIAVVAVALSVLIFVGRLGTVFAVILAIPVSLAGSLIAFSLLGYSFNIVTLLAITVAIGLVIDDAIVVAESIDRYRKQGLPLREAVLRGSSEVASAVMAATMSLLAVFIPISLLPGVIGGFFAQFGITLAAAIGFSYLEAMFFLTMRLALSPDPYPPGWRDLAQSFGKIGADLRWSFASLSRIWPWLLTALAAAALWYLVSPTAAVAAPALLLALPVLRYLLRITSSLLGAIALTLYRGGDWLVRVGREAYVNSLRAALKRSWLVLVVAVSLLASLLWVFPQLEIRFQPPVDSGLFMIEAKLPQGSSLQASNRLAHELEGTVRSYPAVHTVQTQVGTGASTPEEIQLYVTLVPARERSIGTDDLIIELENQLSALLADRPQVELSASAEDAGLNVAAASVSLTLASTDLDLLRARALQASAVLGSDPNLGTPSSTLGTSLPERVFTTEPSRLDGTGLTGADVYQLLRLYNVGAEAGVLREQGTGETPIVVRADPRYLSDELSLASLSIAAPALQTSVPLSSLGSFTTVASPARISRTNQQYSVTLSAPLAGGISEGRAQKQAEQSLLAAGILDSQVVLVEETGIDLLAELITYGPIAFALALLLNYLAIGSQFNSFRYPIYLLLTVPLALVGAIWMLYAAGMDLDVISILGIVMLIGLVTKNAILLLDAALVLARKGMPLERALLEAGHVRFRPIVMTTVTVLVISLPLLLGLGEGSELRQPLGMIILGGVLASAVLTLYVIPAAFLTFEKRRFTAANEASRASTSEVTAG